MREKINKIVLLFVFVLSIFLFSCDGVLKIELSKTSHTMKEGEIFVLTVENASEDLKITWSVSDDEVISLSEQSNSSVKITALKEGSATVTATSGDLTASCQITVNEAPATSVVLSKTSHTMNLNDEVTLTATTVPSGRQVEWSVSDETVLSLSDITDTSVKVKALKAGQATVTAKSGQIEATCQITVNPPAPTQITLQYDQYTMDKGEEFTLNATVTPSDRTVTWEVSNTQYVIITGQTATSVTLKALKVETVTVTAREGETVKTCQITVVDPYEDNKVTHSQTDFDNGLEFGEYFVMNKYYDAISMQNGVITVTLNTQRTTTTSNSLQIRVRPLDDNYNIITQYTYRLTLTNNTDATLRYQGNVQGITGHSWVSVQPGESKEIEYEADLTNATGDKQFNFKLCEYGVGQIVISEIYIIYQKTELAGADNIQLNQETLTLIEGETFDLIATTEPEPAQFTWEVSQEGVIAFKRASGGKIRIWALSEGTVTVTAKSGSVSASCEITVKEPAPEIVLSKTEYGLTEGEEFILEAQITPEDKQIQWSISDDQIATLTQISNTSVKITAIGIGEVIVTAKSGETEVTCLVTVLGQEPSITLDYEQYDMQIGDEFSITATVTPEDQVATWEVSDNTMAQIVAQADNTVTVKAKRAGTVTVTATIFGNVSASCEITITDPYEDYKVTWSQTGFSETSGGKFYQSGTKYDSISMTDGVITLTMNTQKSTSSGNSQQIRVIPIDESGNKIEKYIFRFVLTNNTNATLSYAGNVNGATAGTWYTLGQGESVLIEYEADTTVGSGDKQFNFKLHSYGVGTLVISDIYIIPITE